MLSVQDTDIVNLTSQLTVNSKTGNNTEVRSHQPSIENFNTPRLSNNSAQTKNPNIEKAVNEVVILKI